MPGDTLPKNDCREFASIVQWDEIQYTRTDKKPKPPWAWFRLQLAFLRSPLWCSMTKTQRADFISMCPRRVFCFRIPIIFCRDIDKDEAKNVSFQET